MLEVLIYPLLLLLAYGICRYSFLLPRIDGIPVLMFHKVSDQTRDFLTVTEGQFSEQLLWLKSQGYQSISLAQFLDFTEGKIKRSNLPSKPYLITFDDGYESNLSRALKILKKLGERATLFVTTSYIEQAESGADAQYLKIEGLRQWVSAGMELALHSHDHPNYRQISKDAVIEDLKANRARLESWKLPFHAVVAYPFGARPKDTVERAALKEALVKGSIRAAFRIGNKTHSFREFEKGIDRMDICRIDVRGDDPFFEFKIKVLKGRSRLF